MVSLAQDSLAGGALPEARSSIWRGRRFVAEVFDGADEALAALESIQHGLTSTGFQTLNWLTILYEELAPPQRALARLVVISERNSGDVCLILPLVVKKKRSLRIAQYADLGATPYGAPILGPGMPDKERSVRRVWRAVRRALRDVDLIRLERMPARIGNRKNPLLARHGVTRSRHARFILALDGSVEDHLASLGADYRKDVERCYRAWDLEGLPRFARAQSTDDIARAFSTLREQLADAERERRRRPLLDDPGYLAFYERAAMDGAELDFCYLFTLEAQGAVVATLFGLLHGDTFTVLKSGEAGARWSGLAPGRLILIETMKYFAARGVRRFDLGPGEGALKREIGAQEVLLHDLIIARDLKGWPKAAYHRLRGRLRESPYFRALSRRLRARKRG